MCAHCNQEGQHSSAATETLSTSGYQIKKKNLESNMKFTDWEQ